MTDDAASKTSAATTGKETILLVEDEEIIRLMLGEILRDQGYVVLEASRGNDALTLAANHNKPIDLLVTDMSMPGMNGWDMAHALRATRRGIPVLFTSGHSDHETMQWGKMEPPVEHLYKPFSMEDFLHKARHMLDSHKLPGCFDVGPTVKKLPFVPTRALGVTPLPKTSPVVAPEVILRETMGFVRDWTGRQQGSPGELLRGLEEQVGWPARHVLLEVLASLRAKRDLPTAERKFLNYSLSGGAVMEALAGGVGAKAEHQSALDDLFVRSRRFRRTKKFADAVDFISKFRDYSPFNNMLVFLQNPLVTYFATANHWHKAFRRTIKEEARGLVILAPRTPVLIVYDIEDTEGPALPGKLHDFTQTTGPFNPMILDRTVKNCERDGILVERKAMGALRGGFATARVNEPGWKMRIGLRQQLEPAAAYAVLCHELAHIFLGHVGANKEAGWPHRLSLPHAVTEIEAEAVAHIVCRRAGFRTHAAEYLASFVEDDDNLERVSLDLVSRAAAKIEEMGSRLLK